MQKYEKMINFANMKIVSVLTFALILITACSSKTMPDPVKPEPKKKVASSGSGAGAKASDGQPEKAPDIVAYSVGKLGEVFNDSNQLQLSVAERIGIEPVSSLKKAYHTRRPIVKMESCEDFKIDSLTHSLPYLVPEAAALLHDIGREFGDTIVSRGGDRRNRMVVTSLLRTPEQVASLTKRNRNAVDNSTHMYATTFDISWAKFDCPDSVKSEPSDALKGILAEVLYNLRNQGRCYVKYERKSPCFHITVR